MDQACSRRTIKRSASRIPGRPWKRTSPPMFSQPTRHATCWSRAPGMYLQSDNRRKLGPYTDTCLWEDYQTRLPREPRSPHDLGGTTHIDFNSTGPRQRIVANLSHDTLVSDVSGALKGATLSFPEYDNHEEEWPYSTITDLQYVRSAICLQEFPSSQASELFPHLVLPVLCLPVLQVMRIG